MSGGDNPGKDINVGGDGVGSQPSEGIGNRPRRLPPLSRAIPEPLPRAKPKPRPTPESRRLIPRSLVEKELLDKRPLLAGGIFLELPGRLVDMLIIALRSERED